MKCNIRYLPDDGKRKKAVVQQAIAMPYTRPFGGFEIKAAAFLYLKEHDTRIGGPRRKLYERDYCHPYF